MGVKRQQAFEVRNGIIYQVLPVNLWNCRFREYLIVPFLFRTAAIFTEVSVAL